MKCNIEFTEIMCLPTKRSCPLVKNTYKQKDVHRHMRILTCGVTRNERKQK